MPWLFHDPLELEGKGTGLKGEVDNLILLAERLMCQVDPFHCSTNLGTTYFLY